MIGYKGFDKNFQCRDYQYKIGETYAFDDGDIKVCERGFHFCGNPLTAFDYYPPSNSRYAIVEAVGKIETDDSQKFCTDKITIVREISLDELIQIAANNIDKHSTATNTGCCSTATNTGNRSAAINTGISSAATNTGNRSAAINTGYRSAAINTGYRSTATNTGDRSAAINTGYRSAAINTGYSSTATNTGDNSAAINMGDYSAAVVSGKQSMAIVTGKESKAKGALGCWLVLVEFENGELVDVQSVKVDGVNIMPDTFYMLRNGKPTIVED